MINQPIAVFWFRRDLRLDDNAGLYHALKGPFPVLPLFIFDENILEDLPDKKDARVSFIHQTISQLKARLEAMGSSLLVRYGKPEEVWPQLLGEYSIRAVYTNRDYEPYALRRDEAVRSLLEARGILFHTFKDHVIFEKNEILKSNGEPYVVFTPYSRRWLEQLNARWMPQAETVEGNEKTSFYLAPYPTARYFSNFQPSGVLPTISLAEMGFEASEVAIPPASVTRGLIKNYEQTRNFPGMAGTSRLGIHFRFGTISIREKARLAQPLSAVYLNELIWRDFYSQILAHFPHVVNGPFRLEYDRVPWREAPAEFQRWCEGQTGYPLVDAGMRELNQTGFMHNRVRMVTASFLSKHLLLDWRLGEAYFAQKLLDFDLASNSGGWQWAAGCGTDAAPYFRIFNPTEQAKKFDAANTYIRKWVPEFDTPAYPRPMVDHVFARQRCLEAYKQALK